MPYRRVLVPELLCKIDMSNQIPKRIFGGKDFTHTHTLTNCLSEKTNWAKISHKHWNIKSDMHLNC